jgi:hypothetical protein
MATESATRTLIRTSELDTDSNGVNTNSVGDKLRNFTRNRSCSQGVVGLVGYDFLRCCWRIALIAVESILSRLTTRSTHIFAMAPRRDFWPYDFYPLVYASVVGAECKRDGSESLSDTSSPGKLLLHGRRPPLTLQMVQAGLGAGLFSGLVWSSLRMVNW